MTRVPANDDGWSCNKSTQTKVKEVLFVCRQLAKENATLKASVIKLTSRVIRLEKINQVMDGAYD